MTHRYLKIKQDADYTTLKLKLGIILLLVTLSTCCGAGGNKNSVPITHWQIVTANLYKGEQHVYSLSEYPWKAGVLPDGGVWFMFPSYQSATQAFQNENVVRLWQLYSDTQRSLVGYDNLTFSFSISAQDDTTFFWKTQTDNTCNNTPASVRPMFVAWYQGPFQSSDEWWANQSFPLTPETRDLQVPMAPTNWFNMNGWHANIAPSTLKAFNFAVANVESYGMSFGGGCFAGHGVSTLGGTARIEVHAKPDLEKAG